MVLKNGRSHGIIQKKRFGVCKYRRLNSGYAPTGTIGLSRLLVEVNDVIQVTDTILHEIAHALTLGDGHGYAWKRKCIEIGAKPERCYTNKDTVSPTMRYQAICGGCNAVYQKTRQPKAILNKVADAKRY
jgi:predicted SprT family Zn-dependent metalloprotease